MITRRAKRRHGARYAPAPACGAGAGRPCMHFCARFGRGEARRGVASSWAGQARQAVTGAGQPPPELARCGRATRACCCSVGKFFTTNLSQNWPDRTHTRTHAHIGPAARARRGDARAAADANITRTRDDLQRGETWRGRPCVRGRYRGRVSGLAVHCASGRRDEAGRRQGEAARDDGIRWIFTCSFFCPGLARWSRGSRQTKPRRQKWPGRCSTARGRALRVGAKRRRSRRRASSARLAPPST